MAAVFALGKPVPAVAEDAEALPATLLRTSAILTHPVFHRYRSETEMLRYLHRLEARDLSLTSAMIPLGSCTMKLNATTEMIPVTWRGFSMLHPFAPLEQAQGYSQLFEELEAMLAGGDSSAQRLEFARSLAASLADPQRHTVTAFDGPDALRRWLRRRAHRR